MIVKMFVLTGFFSLYQTKNVFMPNLPLGEYRLVIDKVYPCASMKNHPINYNLYLSKKTSSIKELKGNITYLIPLDDTLTLDANLASWGLTGGWIPNSYIVIKKKACSSIKNLFGNAWFAFIKDFNIPVDNCPLPLGTYISSGLDLKKLEDNNFPKVYFYGKYRLTVRLKNVEDKVVGCYVAEFNLIRPWEKPI
ncbi:uncharacterized protein LOC111029728 [Myzus persicae]|uniref:uncharacterized protein LOC111029728 n=1 Tax=Myzus persicae TaxID=13164 RepID=UPI000B9391E9|nr:uncharacterized protein LOC111029728 [Myzus persicae]